VCRKLYLARSTEIAARKLGDEMMIMCARRSTLFSLDGMATLIWEAADGSTPLDKLVEEKICSEYEVPLDEALRDAEELAAGLAEHGVLMLSDTPFRATNLGGTT
jgi:Coenzyme PQQ synthesis protein D (PqqD)